MLSKVNISILLCLAAIFFRKWIHQMLFFIQIWVFVYIMMEKGDLDAFWMVKNGVLERREGDFFSVYPKNFQLDQHEEELKSFIQQNNLLPPSKLPYSLFMGEDNDPSYGQAETIKKLFKGKKGFFVECGAYNGEVNSNTLILERHLGWEGLLVEADPTIIRDLASKNRKAWILPNCLSTTNHSGSVTFRAWKTVGKIVNNEADLKGERLVNAHCFPLYSVLKAMGRTKIDYFSLDVEGHELDILKTIPFDEIDITSLSVEFTHHPDYFPRSDHEEAAFASRADILNFMATKGYRHRATVMSSPPLTLANDLIFVKEGFNEDVDLEDISGYTVKLPLF